MVSLFFLTFSYLTAVILNDEFFKHEITIDSIAEDIAQAEYEMKNLLDFNDAFEDDIEAQQSTKNPKNKKRSTKTKKGKKGKKDNTKLCCLFNNQNSSSSSIYEDNSES